MDSRRLANGVETSKLPSGSEVCVACQSLVHRCLFQLRGYRVLQCTVCGLAWLAGDTSGVPAIYSERYFVGNTPEGYGDYFALKPALQHTFSKRIEKLERLGLTRDSSLLEVGCGPGLFLELAQRHFAEVCGVEISEFAVKYAREQLGLAVLNAPFEQGTMQGKTFDAVVLWDVLEHLPDPYAALCEVRRVLRPGGWCVLSTGNIASLAARLSGSRWHLLNIPEHLFYFTPNSVRRLLGRCGLQVERISSDFSYYPLFYLIERLCKTALSRPHYRNPDWLVRWASLAVPVSLGDIMTVYATPRQ